MGIRLEVEVSTRIVWQTNQDNRQLYIGFCYYK